MKTRQHDLASLEEARDEALTNEGEIHRAALLEMVYEQAKDDHLERMRYVLEEAILRNDWPKILEIQGKIQAYASTPAFKKRMAAAMARVSEKEATIYMKKSEEGR